jgi:formylglycine-generating enzyme required for sulfatase activity
LTLRLACFALAAVAAVTSTDVAAARPPKGPAGMALVGSGVYRPLYPASPSEREVFVRAFWLDTKPVTNADFLAFVRKNPGWRRDRVKRLFADEHYLGHWALADALGKTAPPKAPVTEVSWFSAKAYCAAKGARLPNEREWELAALASETKPDASADPGFVERILAFYAEPASSPLLRDVGLGKPNFWGVHDLHGLVWEWIYDYGASLVSFDSREKGDVDRNLFCGASGANARDPSDYASFMRIAFRSSLEASTTTARLGFRCARDKGDAS